MRELIYIFSAGEIASGVAIYLHRAGFRVIVSDRDPPSTVRRHVSFSSAIQEKGSFKVEEVEGVFAASLDSVHAVLESGRIAVICDPEREMLNALKPDVLVDATINKRNALQMRTDMAPLVVGLGPELEAGKDVHVCVETCRGHFLGKLIYEGKAIPNTHEPGDIAGFSIERILRENALGTFWSDKKIGDLVQKDEVVGYLEADGARTPVRSQVKGMIRGLLQSGFEVSKPMFKLGDVDPRADPAQLTTISDKSRTVAGGALLAICQWAAQRGRQ